jgi:hypothetical protein
MAGRKPRQVPDDQQGTNPLKRQYKPHGHDPAGNNLPGSLAGHKFGEGNNAARGARGNWRNGLGSERTITHRAAAILEAMLSDPHCADHLRHSLFAASVMAWSRAEAMASLAWEWMERLYAGGGADALFLPQPQIMKTASEVWLKHSESASRARDKLGISPVSYAKIRRDLGLNEESIAQRLGQMAVGGAQIRSRRQAISAETVTEPDKLMGD